MKAGTRERLRKLTLGLALLLAAVVLPLYAIKVDAKHDYTDFLVYYREVTRVRLGQWDQLYNLGDGASPYRYAPPLLPLLRPLAELTLPHARLAWYFLQYLWFAAGFFFLERAMRLTRMGRGRQGGARGESRFITAVSFLFVLRFCLDCFTIGQVSSLLFLGYCASLYAWMARRPGAAGSALLVPSVFKIGPGLLYSLFAAAPKARERVRALGFPLLWILAATLFLRVWCGGAERFVRLWRGWYNVVINDSVYYDASHYGSQSVKSACLRAVKAGWMTETHGIALYLAALLLGCAATLGLWVARRPVSSLGRGALFATGVFPYLWFMPETFKYSLTTLAVPVALLLAAPRKDRLTWFALAFGAATLSLAGLDVVGSRIFFALQRDSVPLVATLLLGAAMWKLAIRESYPALSSALGPVLGPAFVEDERSTFGPWPAFPGQEACKSVSVLLPLPMQSVSRLQASSVRALIENAHARFSASGLDFECLLIPFGNRAGRLHPTWAEAERQVAALGRDGTIRLLPAAWPDARGAALREGLLASKGQVVVAVNAEQPCEHGFYEQALECLRAGQADVVRANRRLPESRFRIPVRYLAIVHGRHRLGLLFNRLVRLLLDIGTTDTHSGSWAMTREAALPVFALIRSPGFLFDLEAWVTVHEHGLKTRDLAASVILTQEKSARRVGLETCAILVGLPALALRRRRGYYRPQSPDQCPTGITADDWGITPGVNQGILELARLGVVKRVSLMSYGGYLREGLEELKAIPGVSLGLHFDLTYGKSTPAQVLARWMRPGADRAALEQEAREELARQLACLREAGVAVSHLDGHHHIHLVPGLLDSLAPAIRQAGITTVRLPSDQGLLWHKPLLWLLAARARWSFRRHGFERLECFYPRAHHFRDQGRLRWRLGRRPDAEVIVHPASVDDLARLKIPDSYTSGRVTEYRALRMLALAWPPGSGRGAAGGS